MPRPITKKELIELAENKFDELYNLIDEMTSQEKEEKFRFEDRDKNVRDVLAHLYEWHQLLLDWIKDNTSGNNVPFLPKEYNWKTYPKMNEKFWEKHQNTPFYQAYNILKDSHKKVIRIIGWFNDDELFAKNHFAWTGGTTLGGYCVSATSSHYNWAIKKIKLHVKGLS